MVTPMNSLWEISRVNISSITKSPFTLSQSRNRKNFIPQSTTDTNNSAPNPDSSKQPNDQTTPPAKPQTPKPSLTPRERLRAARVLSKYTDPNPGNKKSEFGSRVLDAIRESDKGNKKKKGSRLPEAPLNMLDDSKRGLSTGKWSINLGLGNDVLLITFSFVFISTVMFATTYLVWKVGAIHFNEY